MLEKFGSPNLVVVGLWNKAIFSIDWMKKNVYEISPEINIKVEVPIGNFDSSLKYNFEKFSMAIVGNRMEFIANENSPEAYEQIIDRSRVIFRLLSHTPVTDFGINHRFQYDNSEFNFDNLFKFDGDERLSSITGGTIIKNMQKSIRINQSETINVFINDEIKEIGFNFNFNISSIVEIFSIIKENNSFISEKKDQALSILEEVYSLKLR